MSGLSFFMAVVGSAARSFWSTSIASNEFVVRHFLDFSYAFGGESGVFIIIIIIFFFFFRIWDLPFGCNLECVV